jgi:methylated-DNA-[protein]-cysteine S-methyltransferase
MSRLRTLKTPIGTLLIEGDGDAITQIILPGSDGGLPTDGRADASSSPEIVRTAAQQLSEYFAGERTEFDLKLEFTGGTEFQRDVWLSLGEIPFGKTISYAELATMVGRPSAFRAVGQANGANPIPIVLPCHRVIASGGGIGGYGGGLDMKRKLLALEGNSQIAG